MNNELQQRMQLSVQHGGRRAASKIKPSKKSQPKTEKSTKKVSKRKSSKRKKSQPRREKSKKKKSSKRKKSQPKREKSKKKKSSKRKKSQPRTEKTRTKTISKKKKKTSKRKKSQPRTERKMNKGLQLYQNYLKTMVALVKKQLGKDVQFNMFDVIEFLKPYNEAAGLKAKDSKEKYEIAEKNARKDIDKIAKKVLQKVK